MTDIIKARVAFAKERGKMTFKEGKPCVPASDKFCMDLLKGLQGGKDSVKILKAWIAGWAEGNLA